MAQEGKVKIKKEEIVGSDFSTEEGRQAHIERKLAKRAKRKEEREKELVKEEGKEVK